MRCIEWLSRHDLSTRANNAGPDLNTPGAQCIGKNTFEFSMITQNSSSWIEARIHQAGKEVNNPLKIIFPTIAQSPMRTADKVMIKPFGIFSYFETPHVKAKEPLLPTELSFLEIENPKIILSVMKKSEVHNDLIIRVYNISDTPEKSILKLYEGLTILECKIVNLLEEIPKREIKASVKLVNENSLKLSLDPNVIATLRLKIKI